MTIPWLAQGRPRFGCALLALAAISIVMLVYEGSRPPADTGLPSFRGADKLLHFAAHFWVSALMFAGAVLLARPADLRRRVVIVASEVVVFDGLAGLGVEIVQSQSGQGRVFDWLDFGANLAGSVAAIALGLFACWRLSTRKSLWLSHRA